MRLMIEILMALLLGMVGTSWFYESRTNPQPTAIVESTFHPYVAEFERRMGDQMTSVSIMFAPNLIVTETEEGDIQRAAACHAYVLPRQIWVSREIWIKLTEDDRQQLLLHEIGHCLFGLDHVEYGMLDEHENQVYVEYRGEQRACPASLMHPRLDMVRPCYGKYKDYYWNELVRRGGM